MPFLAGRRLERTSPRLIFATPNMPWKPKVQRLLLLITVCWTVCQVKALWQSQGSGRLALKGSARVLEPPQSLGLPEIAAGLKSLPAVILKAEQMNMEGAWRGGMLPRSCMHLMVSGRSPGDPKMRWVIPARPPNMVATSTVYIHATCSI